MADLPPFRYYTDGEYEYRIERGLENSGLHAIGSLTRQWKLADRPVTPSKIMITNFTTNPEVVDDGSCRIRGSDERITPNPWQSGGFVCLPNDADWDVAEKRLLGPELLAACNAVDTDVISAKRLQSVTRATVVVDLGRT